MPKVFTHIDKEVDQEFRTVEESIDDLLATDAGLVQHTATPGGPVGPFIGKRSFWKVGTSSVGGPDPIKGG